MLRLGRNLNGYLGATIAIEDVLRGTLAEAHRHGWTLHLLNAAPDLQIPVLTRAPRVTESWAPRFYVSTGIHGDEPAGPLAVRQLVAADAFPPNAWLWLCPCLNPTGFPRNTRESAAGFDLNRDYRHRRTPEIRAHVAWLEQQPLFDLTLCIHEDWEAAGFYLYELNPDARPSLAQPMLQAVADVCPIDVSPVIDGREAVQGLIRPNLDPSGRPEWPEALYLIQNKTRLSYTVESPSDFDLEVRTSALAASIHAALNAYVRPEGPPSENGPAAEELPGPGHDPSRDLG